MELSQNISVHAFGKIPDTNDETVGMREIVTTNETFKKGTEKNLLIY